MNTLTGDAKKLADYQGKVVLVVNTASKCGLTPQYAGLQKMYEKYKDKGFVVLGFPCNQFGRQEPGTAAEISSFCTKNYGVTFPMFAKVDVNGDGACDLYKHLTALETKPTGAGKISWNFEKFLLNRKGEVVARFSPRTGPEAEEVVSAVQNELKAGND
ncbi:MAG: glutathione peroxidase [Pirellulales bacterium]|nr:glutathione peroxidase [Pirellulales bacterium]